MNEIRRRMAELERARRAVSPEQRAPEEQLAAWSGRSVFDPGGMKIGHVSQVRLDGTGGAWLEVAAEWGILDWLMGMGAGHPHLTFHSDDMETRGFDLVLRQSVLGEGESEAA